MPQHRFHFSCYLLGNPACHLKLHSFTYAMQKSVSGYRILLVLLFVFETITIVYESRRPSRRVARLHDALITLCMFSGAAICLLTVTSLVTGPGTAWHRWGLVRQASRAGWQVMWNVLYPQLGLLTLFMVLAIFGMQRCVRYVKTGLRRRAKLNVQRA